MALVQSGSTSAGTATGLTLSFSGAPTSGNLLVATISHSGNPGAYTPPSGWVQIGSTENKTTLTTIYKSEWYKKNCNTSNSEVFAWANMASRNVAVYFELSGLDTTAPLESSQIANGNSSTLTSASITTTNADDVLVAMFGQATGISVITLSAPTNSFTDLTQLDQSFAGNLCAAITDRSVSATGTYSTGLTSDQSDDWLVRIVAFQKAVVPTDKTQSDTGALSESQIEQAALMQAEVSESDGKVGAILSEGYSYAAQIIVTDTIAFDEFYFVLLYVPIRNQPDDIILSEAYSIVLQKSVAGDSASLTEGYASYGYPVYSDTIAAVESNGVRNVLQSTDKIASVDLGSTRGTNQSTDSFNEVEPYGIRSYGQSTEQSTASEGHQGILAVCLSSDSATLIEINAVKNSSFHFDSSSFRETQKTDTEERQQEQITLGEAYSIEVMTQGKRIGLLGYTKKTITLSGSVEE